MYYVYEYIRLDNNTTFYVGKGKGNRAFKTIQRGEHFENIINKTDVAVIIINDNLSEEEAHNLEKETIYNYVFIEGYGINIKGIGYERGYPYLINKTWGGEGFGGINPYDYADEERKIRWKENIRKGVIKCHNKERSIRMKIAQNRKEVKLKKSLSQKKVMESKREFYSNLAKSRTGEKSANKRKVNVYDKDMNLIKKFNLIKDCLDFYNISASFIWKRDKNRTPYNPPNNFKKKHSHIEGLIFEIATK